MAEIDRDLPMVKARLHLHDAMREVTSGIDPPDDTNGDVVVMGWAAVIDVMHPDGSRTMYRLSSDAIGECELTPWALEGILNYARCDFELQDDGDDA